MKSVRLLKANEFPVQDIPIPEINDDEILLKMKSTAICGTDMRILTGAKTRGVRYPSTIGHEICGIVDKIGKNVVGYKIGDHVAVANVIPCHNCEMCLTGHENACLNRKAIGYEFDGGFEEYLRIPKICIDSQNVIKLPDSISFEEGSLIEPLACCVHGQKNAGVKMDDIVLIEGAGPIGLFHLILAKIAGARKVIISEPNEFRREKARELNADIIINPIDENLEEIIKKETNGYGCDVVILCIGVPTIVNQAFKLAKRNGTVMLFAGFPEKVECNISPNLIHYSEIKVTGSSAYTRIDYHEAANLVNTGQINIKPLITHRYPIEKFQAAYELVKSGKGLKVCIVD